MSVKYTPVQWTRSKVVYDLVVLALVFAYVQVFLWLAPMFADEAKPADDAIVGARAFGTCAFLMLTVILCIGPMARLDKRFLPLLYNRRHFGVIAFLVALTHAMFVINWYFNFSPTPRFEALLTSNISYSQLLGFPFETLGMLALLALAILATTSHDFWLKYLGARLWKILHYSIYAGYALIVGHVAFGSLQSQTNPTFTLVTAASVLLVCGFHVAAALQERPNSQRAQDDEWVRVAALNEFSEGHAQIVRLDNGERVAVFRHEGRLSAISNSCAHQNGPLGEGRIIDGCVTCPWHGFQYRLADGCSPAPFTEKVPTYALKHDGNAVFVSSAKEPPGTYIAPLNIRGDCMMMSGDKTEPFFVGYLPTPSALKLFLFAVSAFLVGAFAALALAIGTAQNDLGAGDFRWSWGAQTVSGRLEVRPYPILHVTKGTEHIPAGRTLLLSGVGKKGVQSRVTQLDGKYVQLKGIALQRGDIDALQVGDAKKAIIELDDASPTVLPVDLGRWKLLGEICDGKCLSGAMRPGTGLSHRACANLCLIGGAPPVFVTRDEVDGQTFFLLGDAAGNPLPEKYLSHVAKLVSLEGSVERRGRILVFKADLKTLEVL